MDTRLLRYFLAIVEEGSISRAASRLHMTQPPLSAALIQLEKDLGVGLVKRTARGIVPSAAGLALTKYGYELLASMNDVRERLRRIDEGRTGDLSLAVVPPFLWGPLPDLLRRFVVAAPDVDVSVSAPAPLEVLEAVRSGKADLGVVSVTETAELRERYGAELHMARAGSFALLAALPPRFAGAPDPFDLTSLDGETWIMARSTLGVASLPEIVRDAWRDHRVRPRRERTVESVGTAMPLIAADLGVALVPEPVRSMPGQAVLLRSLAQDLPPLESTVVWSRKQEPTAAMRRFLAMAMA